MGIVDFAKYEGVGIFLVGAFLAVFTPQPLDFFYFMIQNYLYTHPDLPRLTFTLISIFDWYILDAIWWAFLFFLAYYMHIKKIDTVKIITTVAIIISLGAVAGIIWRFLG